MKKILPIALAVALGFQAKAQTYAPITLSGFTADIIANGFGPALTSTTADVDGSAYNFVSQNYVGPANQTPSTALPANGTINSATTTGLTFQMAPYSGNNSLRITNATGPGTLTFSSPRTADEVYILATTAFPSTYTATVNFTDATTQVFTGLAVSNWYDGPNNIAIKGISRVKRNTDVIENSITNPRIYQFLLSLNAANITKPIQGITFTKTTTGANEILHIMGVTIRSVASTIPNDVGITGITSPNSGCGLTSQETITVSVTNFGSAAQSNIPVSYTINGGNPVNETLTASLAPNATTNYTFTTKANLSAINTYNLVASTNLSGDAQVSNNVNSKTVTMAAAPATPGITASGTTNFCPGSSVSLTATTTATGVTFQWFKDGTLISGATSTVYSANTAGSYMAAVNANGCISPTSTAITLTTSAAPAKPTITAGGPATICTGGSVTLTANSATSGATFTWLKNGSSIPGATGATYSATSAGNYSVMALSSGCNSSVSYGINVTVNTKPVTPTISQSGSVLTSSSGVGNQWYKNGTIIPGATASIYTATTSGSYTVIVTTNGCSSPASNTVTITATSVKEEITASGVLIYPNPNHGTFEVKLNGIQKNGSIEIYNITGQLIATYPIVSNQNGSVTPVSLQHLAPGTYVLKVTSDKTVNVGRLIIE
jgi:hypothetical protein